MYCGGGGGLNFASFYIVYRKIRDGLQVFMKMLLRLEYPSNRETAGKDLPIKIELVKEP